MNKYEIAGVSAGVLILAALFGWIFTAPYLSNQGLGRMPGLIIGGTLTEAPEDLVPQFEYIRKSVNAFNLPSVELTNYEADDLIATYAKKIIKAGAKVTVISSDKDLMQLVSDNIRLYDPMKSKVLGE